MFPPVLRKTDSQMALDVESGLNPCNPNGILLPYLPKNPRTAVHMSQLDFGTTFPVTFQRRLRHIFIMWRHTHDD